MREYEDRREIEKFYETAKKNIKKMIEDKGVACNGSANGRALSEIIAVIDKELEIGIAEELVKVRRMCREYYKKYSDVERLDRQYKENEEKLKEQAKVVGLVEHLSDEVLKNAIIAYSALNDGRGRYGSKEDAKAIAIAYINANGRGELKNVLEEDFYEKGKAD